MHFSSSILALLATVSVAVANAPDERLFTKATMPPSAPPYVYFKVVDVGEDGEVLGESYTSFEHLGARGKFGRVFKWDALKEDLANCLTFQPPMRIDSLASQLTTWMAESSSHKNCLVADMEVTSDIKTDAAGLENLSFDDLQKKWIAAHDEAQSDEFQTAIASTPMSNLVDNDLSMVAFTGVSSEDVGERFLWIFWVILYIVDNLKPESPFIAAPPEPMNHDDIDAWELNADGSYTPLDLESETDTDTDVEYPPDGPIWVQQPDGTWATHTPIIIDVSPDK